jgi:D-glycero-D-manno-heptose 1,7-bisphosphate phosphatase
MNSPRPFILLDRDGTLNVEKHYLSDPDQLELYPGTGAALRRLRELGYGLAVLTNQSGIGRGYFDLATVERIHERLAGMLAAEGASVDGFFICPHTPDEVCDCRKPLPGMARQAMAQFGFEPTQAIMIGDKAADIGVGQAIGAATVLVRTGWGADSEKARDCTPDVIVDDLAGAVAWIEANR